MAHAAAPEQVRFFAGVLAADTDCLAAAREALAREWGPIDLASDILPFRYTDYYAREAGPEIVRAFFAFQTPGDPGDLAARKRRANALEQELAAGLACAYPRPVNLDPGYLTPDKLVLASCKNFAHRIYLADGVYAEMTLSFRRGRFQALPWTFPDYASGDYDPFFLALRARLMAGRAVPKERA